MSPTNHDPSYLRLSKEAIDTRSRRIRERMSSCDLCPRNCGVDRLSGELGRCATGERALVASAGPHMGEEKPLRGTHGSGTIFFAGCNLGCIFCQNWELSAEPARSGRPLRSGDLGALMLQLQELGCHNINLVSPSHVAGSILDAISWAAERGLRLPLVYNSGGYDSVDTLRYLEDVVDIYMPDFKYWDPGVAASLSDAPDYPEIARNAISEMHRQVGDLTLDAAGVATRGLLVRHLVLPGDLSGTAGVTKFLAHDISRDTFLNIMDQYRPAHRSRTHPPLDRPVREEEIRVAIRLAEDAGLRRIYERHR